MYATVLVGEDWSRDTFVDPVQSSDLVARLRNILGDIVVLTMNAWINKSLFNNKNIKTPGMQRDRVS